MIAISWTVRFGGCHPSSAPSSSCITTLGWGQAEVAATLGIPLGTVKSRLHYATAALRAAVEADSRTTSAPTSEERLA